MVPAGVMSVKPVPLVACVVRETDPPGVNVPVEVVELPLKDALMPAAVPVNERSPAVDVTLVTTVAVPEVGNVPCENVNISVSASSPVPTEVVKEGSVPALANVEIESVLPVTLFTTAPPDLSAPTETEPAGVIVV